MNRLYGFGFALLPHSGYGEGMTLEAIKEAVVHLSQAEREQFAHWFEELEEEAWDKEIERDFAPGGRGAHLIEKIDSEIDRTLAAGNVTSLDDGLRVRREQRASK
ncbi:MAG: hypothetical protein HY820_00485 [Acidobacteria bacterium]|nr:hypothetical protein [Acidobacteriota bacterium]